MEALSHLEDDSLEAMWPPNTSLQTAEIDAPAPCLSLSTGMSVTHFVMLDTERRNGKVITV